VASRDTLIRHLPSSFGRSRLVGIMPDGSRFLALVSDPSAYQLVIVPDWRAELRVRMAAGASSGR
jgi:hypothetical protein